MSQHILTLYKLPAQEFRVCQKEIVDDALHISVTVKTKKAACPGCGEASSSHYDTRSGISRIRYDLWYGHVIFLELRKRRFSCRNGDCPRGVFTETVPGCSGRYRRSAAPFEAECLKILSERTFSDTAAKSRASHSFLVGLLSRSVPARLAPTGRIDWEREFAGHDRIALGIDEHSQRRHREVMTVTNLTTNGLIAILPDAKKATLEGFLRQIPSKYRKRIEFTATDLTNRYRHALKKWIPRACPSADCFHVVRLANQLVTETARMLKFHNPKAVPRTRLWLLRKGRERLKPKQRERLDALLSREGHERLAFVYRAKEDLRKILRTKNAKRAERELAAFLRRDVWNRERLSRDELLLYSKKYRTFIETLQSWKTEIVSYLRTGVTNAYTEGIHTKIKTTKRMSYGIPNLDTYIRKMMLTCRPELHHI